jgi:cyclopentanol dehydrogenase
MRLAGKVALITGAAAGVEGELMGFGGAAARLFAREGARVVLTDIKEEMGRKAADQIQAQGGEALFLRHDVTSEEDWQEVIHTAVARFGTLNVLVNNAGTGARFTVEETTVEVWNAQMDVHAKGAFLGTKHAIPVMRQAGGGSIINVSSIYGLVGSPTSTAYHAAKGAIRLFTKAAAI